MVSGGYWNWNPIFCGAYWHLGWDLGSCVSIVQNNVIGVNSGQEEEPPRSMASISGLGKALVGDSGQPG